MRKYIYMWLPSAKYSLTSVIFSYRNIFSVKNTIMLLKFMKLQVCFIDDHCLSWAKWKERVFGVLHKIKNMNIAACCMSWCKDGIMLKFNKIYPSYKNHDCWNSSEVICFLLLRIFHYLVSCIVISRDCAVSFYKILMLNCKFMSFSFPQVLSMFNFLVICPNSPQLLVEVVNKLAVFRMSQDARSRWHQIVLECLTGVVHLLDHEKLSSKLFFCIRQ